MHAWHLDVCNSGTVWTIAKQTAPLCAAKCALHDGVNISVCENNSKWSVFSDQVTYIGRCLIVKFSNAWVQGCYGLKHEVVNHTAQGRNHSKRDLRIGV